MKVNPTNFHILLSNKETEKVTIVVHNLRVLGIFGLKSKTKILLKVLNYIKPLCTIFCVKIYSQYIYINLVYIYIFLESTKLKTV